MRLLAHLLLGILAVVLLCLAATTAWVLRDAHNGIETATRTSAERAVQQLQAVYWQELVWRDGLSRSLLLPRPEWETLATVRVIAPGICIGFGPAGETPRTLCSEAEGVYPPAPAWFGALYGRLFGTFPKVSLPLDVRQRSVGDVSAAADPETALRLAWMQIDLILEVAAAMAGAIGLLVAALVAHALMPVRTIIEGLRRLETGDYTHRLERRGRLELGLIAAAVNALADRLARTQAARAALTRQLFQVQEDERRALARDLHDEFGQCLAATGALAASIATGAADRPDLVADAGAIAAAARRMMGTLKEALVRLRSQDIDDLGLEACLEELVAKWNGRSAAQATVHLDMGGDLARVPRPVAISLYRIAQECLTNAARHGAARHIRLKIDGPEAGAETVVVSVEDDGGGDLDGIAAGTGHGLLGIRERIAALGGSLAIGRAARGIRVAATIPFGLPAEAGASPRAA